MSGNIVHDLPSWAKDIGRRVELLERKRQHRGDGGGGRAVWVTQPMTFVGGAASIPLPVEAGAAGTVVATFAEQTGGPLNAAAIDAGQIHAFAAVPDGDYLVSLVFGPV